MRTPIKKRRAIRGQYGAVLRLSPRKGGALAQCKFCMWGEYFEDNQRLRYSAMARASASLREHTRRVHADKLPKLWIPPKENEENES